MKKIVFVLVIIMITCFGSSVTWASTKLERLQDIKILPESITDSNLGETISRAEFAYIAARMLHNVERQTSDTPFIDVAESNVYSGYINELALVGYVKGDGTGQFYPDRPISYNEALKIIISVIGYGDLINSQSLGNEYYEKIADQLGVLSKVRLGQNNGLTKGSTVDIVYHLLTAKINDVNYYYDQGEPKVGYSQSKKRILNDNLGISVYEGTINSINQSTHSVTFLVKKNTYDTNPTILAENESAVFSAADNIDINHYKMAPVIVWVDKEEKIISIELQRNIEIKYVQISSVNNDTDESSAYSVPNIKTITFYDDKQEYIKDDDTVFLYNEMRPQSHLKLIGKMARVVVEKDVVKLLQSWDLVNEGIVKEFRNGRLSYQKFNGNDAKIENISQHKTTLVFINQRSAGLNEIKSDSVFSYYQDEDTFVIWLSEKNIIDVLDGVSDDGVVLGGYSYDSDEIYFTSDGKKFTKNNEYAALLNVNVKAYFAPGNKIICIMPFDLKQVLQSKFYGVVEAVQKDRLDNKKAEIKLWACKDTAEPGIYYLTRYTKYLDEINLEELIQNSSNYSGQGIYLFEVNSNGNILSVSRPQYFYGYGDQAVATISSTFANVSYACVTISGSVLYFPNVPITAIHRLDDAFCVTQVDWKDLQGRSAPNAKLTFYGEGKESVPSLVVLTGNIQNIGALILKRGILTGKSRVMVGDEIRYKLTVVSGSAATEYLVKESVAQSLPKYALLRYYDDVKFWGDDIYILSHIDLTANHDSWELTQTKGSTGLHRGTVEKADKNRLCFYEDGGSAYFMHPDQSIYLTYYENVKKFDKLDVNDIQEGDTVYYFIEAGDIKVVILLK